MVRSGGASAPVPRVEKQAVSWRWATPEAQTVLSSRDLGTILRFHRRIHGLSQTALADQLGYEKTYVCLLETGRRTINDVATRRRIAASLGLPAHLLGVTDTMDTDFATLLTFAWTTRHLPRGGGIQAA